VAGDQPGDGPVTDVLTPTGQAPIDRWNRLLTNLVILLAALAVVGGVFVFREHQGRSSEGAGQDRYAEVQEAASAEVTALLNIDYRDPQATIDKVKAGATDDFAKQFESAEGGLVKLTAQARSVMTGEVLWTGVVDVDPDSATVIVATAGTVTNTQTGDQPAARNFRIKVGLVNQDGRWLAASLDFVQVPL
jgi:Mce-associated membrane protein